MMRVLSAALSAVLGAVAVVPTARAASDYTSFFSEPALAGAGWAACPDPVTWSVDMRGLESSVARQEVRRLKQSWAQWSAASGVPVKFAGREPLVFNPATNGLDRPDGSAQPMRHVYIAFKSPQEVPLMMDNTVGMAMPTTVLLPSREIVGGMAVVRRGYVLEQRRVKPARIAQLYMHEIGHVMGLGHAGAVRNVMYPQMDHLGQLGPGDRAGARAFVQGCDVGRSGVPVRPTASWE